jgi:hypothetical protein
VVASGRNDNESARINPNPHQRDCVYRILGANGEGEKARHRAGPSPLYTTGCGARVARQRCPILRAGMNKIPDVTGMNNLSVGTRKAINAVQSVFS